MHEEHYALPNATGRGAEFRRGSPPSNQTLVSPDGHGEAGAGQCRGGEGGEGSLAWLRFLMDWQGHLLILQLRNRRLQEDSLVQLLHLEHRRIRPDQEASLAARAEASEAEAEAEQREARNSLALRRWMQFFSAALDHSF